MKLKSVLWLLAGIIFAAAAPASAHMPYVTKTEKMQLEPGRIGEMRLLHGDGIFSADPVRAVIVDASGRAVARSPKSYSMAIVCNSDRKCHAFDLNRNVVYEANPADFKSGAVVRTDEDLWGLESGEDAWGFRVRPATLFEMISVNLASAVERMHTIVIAALLAGLATAVALADLRKAATPGAVATALWIAVNALRVMAVAILAVLNLYLIAIADISVLIWLIACAAGVGAALLLIRALSGSSGAAKPAA